jgi:hypothetical protein
MTRSNADVLLLPRDELALALAADAVGRERDWLDSFASALMGLEEALRQHIALAEHSDGIYGTVDLTRPTLVRQINHLRRQHSALLSQVRELQAQVHRAARAFQPGCPLAVLDGLPSYDPPSSIPDLGALRAQAQRFMVALAHHEEEEDLVVLESITAEIGTGD